MRLATRCILCSELMASLDSSFASTASSRASILWVHPLLDVRSLIAAHVLAAHPLRAVELAHHAERRVRAVPAI